MGDARSVVGEEGRREGVARREYVDQLRSYDGLVLEAPFGKGREPRSRCCVRLAHRPSTCPRRACRRRLCWGRIGRSIGPLRAWRGPSRE